MKAAIELHQLAEVRHPLPPPPMRAALARPTPQARRQHPPPQRFVIDGAPRLHSPNARPPASARIARPRRRCISRGSARAPASRTPPRRRPIRRAARRSDVSGPSRPPPDTADTAASPGGSSPPSTPPPISTSTSPPRPAPTRPRASARSYSSPSAPIHDLLRGRKLRGTFLTSPRGDIIKESQQWFAHGEVNCPAWQNNRDSAHRWARGKSAGAITALRVTCASVPMWRSGVSNLSTSIDDGEVLKLRLALDSCLHAMNR